MNIIERVKKLNFPFGEYVIVGGGILDALGIRPTVDIDVAITPKLFKELQAAGEWEEEIRYDKIFLKKDDIEISPSLSWPEYPTTTEEAIASATVIDGVPFLNLEELKRFKTASGREKDLADLALIEEYQKNKSTEESLINWAKEQLEGEITVTREPHGDQSTVYFLKSPDKNYFLKIASSLQKEFERLKWLSGKLPVPEVIGFTHSNDKDALLLSVIEGTNLAKLCKEWNGEKVAKRLAGVLLKFHSVDANGCSFGTDGAGKVLIHGDACLPNFIFNNDNFSGYIDLGDARIDFPEADLSAAVWSLQYNLGSGYGLIFLNEYGIKDATDELVEKLRLKYENMQKEWGLI